MAAKIDERVGAPEPENENSAGQGGTQMSPRNNKIPASAVPTYITECTGATVTVAQLSLIKKVGYVAMFRAPELFDMVAQPRHHGALILLIVVAARARYSKSPSLDGLKPGECLIGDYENYGLTEQQYRTAKAKLERWKFVTFTGTSDGTIAKLLVNPIFQHDFDPSTTKLAGGLWKPINTSAAGDPPKCNTLSNEQATTPKILVEYDLQKQILDGQRTEQRSSNDRATTNNQGVTKEPSKSLSLCGAETKGEPSTGERESDFEAVWNAYPRKDGKAAASKAWEEANDRPPIDHILEAIRIQKKSRQWKQEGDRFIPKLVNWILDRRWEDVPEGAFKKTPTPHPEEQPLSLEEQAQLAAEFAIEKQRLAEQFSAQRAVPVNTQEEIDNKLIIEAVEHLEELIRRGNQWSRQEKLTWHGLMKLSGRELRCLPNTFQWLKSPDDFEPTFRRYVAIAQDLRRQLLEQLAKRQGIEEQGQLFD